MTAVARKRNFQANAVQAHVLSNLRGCPDDIAAEIVGRVVERTWSPPVELGRAVGLVATNLVRHRLTDYERMLDVNGLTREEARLAVAPEVEAIIAGWRNP